MCVARVLGAARKQLARTIAALPGARWLLPLGASVTETVGLTVGGAAAGDRVSGHVSGRVWRMNPTYRYITY